MLRKEIPILDELLHAHAAELGHDFVAYRNHTYRVVNLCAALTSPDAEQLERITIAAAFHDLGIWTDGTFDYLPPSIRSATAFLEQSGKTEWTEEITGMIREHHKISRCRAGAHNLVEPFRRSDWIDVSHGLLSFGLSRPLLKEIFSTWPNAGFHKRLIQLGGTRLRTHPWNPLPMMRL